MIRIDEGKAKLASTCDCHFEGLREIRVPVIGDALRDGLDVLVGGEVRCLRGKSTRSAYGCLSCERFVNYVPSTDGSEVTIRCLWSDSDTVEELMTPASMFISVLPDTVVGSADDLARAAGIHHLLVVEDDVLIGLTCRCDFLPPADPWDRVSERVRRTMWITRSTTKLSDVAGVMAHEGIGCLPVVEDSVVQGIITSRDLDRAGVGHSIDEEEGGES